MTTSDSIKKPPTYLLDGKGGGRQIAHKMRDQEPPTGETLWLQLDYTDEDAQRWLTDASDIDPIVLETLLAEDTRPRCFVHGNGLLVTLRGVNLNPGEDGLDQNLARTNTHHNRQSPQAHGVRRPGPQPRKRRGAG